MPIPDFQTLMLPLLKFTDDDLEHTMAQARDTIAKKLALSENDIKEMLPSGKQTIFGNRVAWAKSYLSQAGLLESPKRGVFKISLEGKKLSKHRQKESLLNILNNLMNSKNLGMAEKAIVLPNQMM